MKMTSPQLVEEIKHPALYKKEKVPSKKKQDFQGKVSKWRFLFLVIEDGCL